MNDYPIFIHEAHLKALEELRNPKAKPKRLRDRNKKRSGRMREKGWKR